MLHRPARTMVSVAGIGIGILLIVFTIGLANGSMRERADRDKNVGAELEFVAAGSWALGGTEMRLPIALKPDLERVEGVAAAVPIVQKSVQSNEGITGSRLIDGIDYPEYAAMAGLTIVQGRPFVQGADEMMSDAAWLERRKLNIGDKFSIYERDFTIVGTYEPSAGARIKIPISTMQSQLGGEGKTSGFLIDIKPGYEIDKVGDNVMNSFPANQYQLIKTSELEELYMQGVPALNVFLDVVVGVAAAISGLIILLTMYTTVTERTRQIGVLKSLGMSNAGIAWTIVQEALLISIGGVVIGVFATALLSVVLAKFTTLTVSIEPRVVLVIIVVGLASGVVGAIYPGLRAARLDAVEALNYD